jgi:hypothetical protein
LTIPELTKIPLQQTLKQMIATSNSPGWGADIFLIQNIFAAEIEIKFNGPSHSPLILPHLLCLRYYFLPFICI